LSPANEGLRRLAGVTSRPSRSALAVGGGIFVSRITGLARDVAIAAFFGTHLSADAYYAALKIPNVIRNLLGEGTLSAAFVPVYSEVVQAEGANSPAARRLAGGILMAVATAAALLSGIGVLIAPWLIRVVAPGIYAATPELATSLVRILFPMAGMMILGAWCLGILNTHRRFFLPFVAPALWNLTQVGALLLGSALGWGSLVHVLAWSALLGGVAQVGIQLPLAQKLARAQPLRARPWREESVRKVLRNTLPVISSQGIFQISSFVDVVLASLLGTGAISAMTYAQRLVYLPLSLFGISVAASSLPEMSREAGGPALRDRLANGFLQILYFVLPAALALMLFGDLMIRLLLQRGRFSAGSSALVATVLIAYAAGLVATSSVKLLASGFHARQDTRTPMRFAAISVGVGVACGASLMLVFRAHGYGVLSVSGLALGGAAGAWLNLLLLWQGLSRRVGPLFDIRAAAGVARIVFGSLLAVGASVAADHWLGAHMDGGSWLADAVRLTGTLAAGGVGYVVIIHRPPTVAHEA